MEKKPIVQSDQLAELTRGMDAFLDENYHSEEAYEKVQNAIEKFDFMVQLAVSRALSEIYGEQPYVEDSHEATILEFPMERIKPPKNTILHINHDRSGNRPPFWIE